MYFLFEHWYLIPIALVGLLVLFFVIDTIIEEKKKEKSAEDIMSVWEFFEYIKSPEYTMNEGLDKLILDFSKDYNLTKSEKNIFPYKVKAQTNKEIADRFCVVEKTIKFHVSNIFKKLEVKNSTALVYKVFSTIIENKLKGERIKKYYEKNKNMIKLKKVKNQSIERNIEINKLPIVSNTENNKLPIVSNTEINKLPIGSNIKNLMTK